MIFCALKTIVLEDSSRIITVHKGDFFRSTSRDVVTQGYARRLTKEETKAILNNYAKTFEKLMEGKLRETRPCHWCGKTDKWESIYGAIVCSDCQAPIKLELVKRWIGGKTQGKAFLYQAGMRSAEKYGRKY